MGKRIEREVESYVNDFEQTIRVGDEVVYPVRWGSSLELKRGRVVRIYEFDRDRYDWETKGNKVEALRRVALHQDVPISYNPLAVNPDYIVIGPFSQGWQVYDAALATGAFRSVYANDRYIVYERIP